MAYDFEGTARPWRLAILLAGIVCLPVLVSAQDSPSAPGQRLIDLSLDQLGAIEVTSVSKQPEEVWRTPVAITVITREDIRRSGFTSLPEVLRLAPGVEVARIDSAHWSIGVRGLGDSFAKSLLVLVDGRSLYTPLFAGTYWPAHVVFLEDVERIEVIRGPGGAIWGGAAVTGVINVITRAAADTRGALAAVTTGTIDRGIASLRYGGGNGNSFNYRGWAKGFTRAPQFHSDNATFDKWWMSQAGVRGDWKPRPRDLVTLQGEISTGRHGQRVAETLLSPPSVRALDGQLEAHGANLMARWERRAEDGTRFQLQAYYDWTSWAAPHFEERRHTLDVDLVQGLRPLARHTIVWGAGARYSPSRFTQTIPVLDFTPAEDTQRVYSAFVQDEISFAADRVTVTGGTKFEHNQYTGLELQPSLRGLWRTTPTQTVWGSIARAVRTPSRIERSVRSLSLFSPGPPFPVFVRAVGSDTYQSETLLGVELGFRTALGRTAYLDLATFRNSHDDLAAFGAAVVSVETSPPPARAVGTVPYVNGAEGVSSGYELSADWRLAAWWRLGGSYSYVKFDARLKPGTLDIATVTRYEGSSPRHQVRAESRLQLPAGGEMDAVYRYVSDLPARQVGSYHTADIRTGWRAGRGLTLDVSAQNLLQPRHVEFGMNAATAVAISRSIAVTATWSRAQDTP